MNNMKNQLKALASKQEVHDLSKDILKNVDTNRVIIAPEYTYSKKRSTKWIPGALIGAAACAVLITSGVVIGQRMANDGNGSTNISGGSLQSSVELPENICNAYVQDAYNLVNVVQSYDSFKFDTVIGDELSKQLTASEENNIVNDLEAYKYNIYDMMGLVSVQASKMMSDLSEYNNLVEVNGSAYTYSFYYSVDSYVEKNIGQENYRYSADITGMVVYGSLSFELNGSIDVKNGETIYNTTLIINEEKYINCKETFGPSENTYEYIITNDTSSKYILVTQKLSLTGETTKISIKSMDNKYDANVYYNIESIEQVNNVLSFKLKSANNDYVLYNLQSRTYMFKNSQNIYKK